MKSVGMILLVVGMVAVFYRLTWYDKDKEFELQKRNPGYDKVWYEYDQWENPGMNDFRQSQHMKLFEPITIKDWIVRAVIGAWWLIFVVGGIKAMRYKGDKSCGGFGR